LYSVNPVWLRDCPICWLFAELVLAPLLFCLPYETDLAC
jgi:hypothetical protein